MIQIITGAMKAGKTKELNRIIENLRAFGFKYKVFYPAQSSKVIGSRIVSRNGTESKAIKIYDVNSILNYIYDEDLFIIFDEFQFFDSDFVEIIKKIDKPHRQIICSGLNLDYRGNPWEETLSLYALADEIINLSTTCEICGVFKANRTLRLTDGIPTDFSEDVKVIDGSDNIEYKSVCKTCYEEQYGF